MIPLLELRTAFQELVRSRDEAEELFLQRQKKTCFPPEPVPFPFRLHKFSTITISFRSGKKLVRQVMVNMLRDMAGQLFASRMMPLPRFIPSRPSPADRLPPENASAVNRCAGCAAAPAMPDFAAATLSFTLDYHLPGS